jgi:TM2 domain-containing membrane protein YozV
MSGAAAMYLEIIATGIILLGLALTCYCLIRLSVSYRVVARYLDEHVPDQEHGDISTNEQ